MISSRNLFFCTFANYLCCFFILLFNSFEVLANKKVSNGEESLSRDSIAVSSFDRFQPKTLFSSDGLYFLSFFESLLIFCVVLFLLFILWYLSKPNPKIFSVPGFKLININENKNFVNLKSEIQSLEFLENLEISKKYRLSGNLNRVILTPHKNTFLLEDKNFKNALLINRRRLHRKVLFNNDLLDIGEMVLLYSNNLFQNNFHRESHSNNQSFYLSTKPKGPIQKGVPFLNVSSSKQEIPLLRNLNTLGTSKINDIVIESNEVALRHAKIYKVGQSWKIQNLQNHENTFVNGRRIDQRLLKEGDEVAIGDFIFKFTVKKSQIKRQKKIKKENKVSSV